MNRLGNETARTESNPIDHRSGVPGKRTRTEALSTPRSVRGLDDTVEPNFTRDTIDTPAHRPVPLTDAQLQRACRANPIQIRRQRFASHNLSPHDTTTVEFAWDVAEKQRAHGGLVVDGIAGPKTITALFGTIADLGKSRPDLPNEHEIGHTAEGFEGEDPFGMHLIGSR